MRIVTVGHIFDVPGWFLRAFVLFEGFLEG